MKKIIGVALLVGAFLNAVALNKPSSLGSESAELRVFSVKADRHCIYVIIQGPMIKFDNFYRNDNLNLPVGRYKNLICNPINIRSNMTNEEVIKVLEDAFDKQPTCKVKHLLPGNYPEDWNHKIEKLIAERSWRRYLKLLKNGKLIAKNEASQSYLELFNSYIELLKSYLEPSESEKLIAGNGASQSYLELLENGKIAEESQQSYLELLKSYLELLENRKIAEESQQSYLELLKSYLELFKSYPELLKSYLELLKSYPELLKSYPELLESYPELLENGKIAEESQQSYLEPSKSEKLIAENEASQRFREPRCKQVRDLIKRGVEYSSRFLKRSESEKLIAENEASQHLLEPSKSEKLIAENEASQRFREPRCKQVRDLIKRSVEYLSRFLKRHESKESPRSHLLEPLLTESQY